MEHRTYDPGNWKVICDICGFQFMANELFTDYRGLKVCEKDLDKRNPQDFVRPVAEKITPPWTRPDQDSIAIPAFWVRTVGSTTIVLWYRAIGTINVEVPWAQTT